MDEITEITNIFQRDQEPPTSPPGAEPRDISNLLDTGRQHEPEELVTEMITEDELELVLTTGDFQMKSEKNQPNGYAGLDPLGKIPVAQVPAIPGDQTWRVSVGRGSGNTTDQWLRDANGVATNLTPIRVPWACELIRIVATGNAVQSWDAEVYSGAIPRAGGVPSDASKDIEIAVSVSNSADVSTAVAYNAGDELGIFLRGTSIDWPRVDLHFRRTA